MTRIYLLAALAAALAGCASTPDTQRTQASKAAQMEDRYAETGTRLPRRRGEAGVSKVGTLSQEAVANGALVNPAHEAGLNRDEAAP